MTVPECPSCRVRMNEGFIIELQHGNTRTQSEWLEGKPERSLWLGLKVKGRKRFKVLTYRCPHCGFLQSYAPA